MAEVPTYSFYSDVCKLLAIACTIFNLLVLYAIGHAIFVGPSDGFFALVVLWFIVSFCSNFFWKRGWPATSARMREKAVAQRNESWEQFKKTEWPQMKAGVSGWASRALTDKNGNSFFGAGEHQAKDKLDPEPDSATVVNRHKS